MRIPVLSVLALVFGIPLALARRRQGRLAAGIVAGAALLSVVAYPALRVDLPGSGARGLDEEAARGLVESLMGNVYLALEGRSEEDVYDKLAVTVAGDLLTDVYLDHRRAFAVAQAGGAQAKVERVEVEVAGPERAGSGYRFDATWLAEGSVGHWGHLHYRTNKYRAEIMLEPVDGSWRITGMTVLDEERTL